MIESQAPAPVPSIERYGAIAVVVREDRFLVIRRSALVAAPRMFCFPGGGIEPGETEPQALVREIDEELGVPITPIRCVWRNVTRWHVALAWWLGEIDTDASIRPHDAEVESFHWMTIAEMLAAPELMESNRQFLEALAAGEVDLT